MNLQCTYGKLVFLALAPFCASAVFAAETDKKPTVGNSVLAAKVERGSLSISVEDVLSHLRSSSPGQLPPVTLKDLVALAFASQALHLP